MIALYIIGAIVLLVFLLLISSVSVFVKYSDELSVKVGFWFFRFNTYPADKSKKRKSKKIPHKSKNDNLIMKLIAEKGLVAAISEIASIVKILLVKAGKTAKHIRVKKFYFLVTAASADPAKTAVLYGSLCSVVFPALKGFQEIMKFNDRRTKVLVLSDFNNDSPTVEIDLKLKLRVWFILKAAFGVLIQLIKRKIKGNISNAK